MKRPTKIIIGAFAAVVAVWGAASLYFTVAGRDSSPFNRGARPRQTCFSLNPRPIYGCLSFGRGFSAPGNHFLLKNPDLFFYFPFYIGVFGGIDFQFVVNSPT